MIGREPRPLSLPEPVSPHHFSYEPHLQPCSDAVDLTRPLDLHLTFGMAPRERLGRKVGLLCLLQMLRSVANLPNLQRAPGDAGQLKLVTRPGGLKQYMTPDFSAFSSFPTSKMILPIGVRCDANWCSYDALLRSVVGGSRKNVFCRCWWGGYSHSYFHLLLFVVHSLFTYAARGL